MNRRTVVAVCGLVWGVATGPYVASWPAAQEADESEAAPKVSGAELQLYIDVYSAMQADHDLTIEEAVRQHGISLEKFREIERRIQTEQRLVEKVRLALLNQAKSRNFWGAQPTPSPPSVSSPPQREILPAQ